jgi:hypothetical protein
MHVNIGNRQNSGLPILLGDFFLLIEPGGIWIFLHAAGQDPDSSGSNRRDRDLDLPPRSRAGSRFQREQLEGWVPEGKEDARGGWGEQIEVILRHRRKKLGDSFSFVSDVRASPAAVALK